MLESHAVWYVVHCSSVFFLILSLLTAAFAIAVAIVQYSVVTPRLDTLIAPYMLCGIASCSAVW